jgi:hypothetical protein
MQLIAALPKKPSSPKKLIKSKNLLGQEGGMPPLLR